MSLSFIQPIHCTSTNSYLNDYNFDSVPSPYIKDCLLSRHLQKAMFWPTLDFDTMRHVSAKSGAFKCVSYYSDDDQESNAHCEEQNGVFYSVVNMYLVRNLVAICHELKAILQNRKNPAFNDIGTASYPLPKLVSALDEVLEMRTSLSDGDIDLIVAGWPAPEIDNGQFELSEFVIFYDLVRLIWVHEWAHALCGHVTFGKEKLNIATFHEFSKQRLIQEQDFSKTYTKNEIFQAIEMHADQFSVRYNTKQILWGNDPILTMAGPKIDLADRILMFNIALCVFAVWSDSSEKRFYPDATFYPPLSRQDISYIVTESSHPPAELRYLHCLDLMREEIFFYDSTGQANVVVNNTSMKTLYLLIGSSKKFSFLLANSLAYVKSPEMKRLIAYEAHLLKIGESLSTFFKEMAFYPTRS